MGPSTMAYFKYNLMRVTVKLDFAERDKCKLVLLRL
jgi:hypothetical protein